MTDPIVVEVEVAATPEHAFRVWTQKADSWWPASHSMSGTEDFKVVFEPFVGGRIFEVAGDGREFDWGEITEWDPPRAVSYKWHIFLERDKATLVDVRFSAIGYGTRVRLVNSGFDVFDDDVAAERVGRVESAWGSLLASYQASV